MWFIYFHSVWALCSAFWVRVNNFHILQASTMVFALLQLWARNFSLKQWTHWVAWHCPSAVCNLPLAQRDPAKSSAQLCSPTAEKVLGKPEAQCLPAGWGLSTGLCCLHLCVWEKFRASVAVAQACHCCTWILSAASQSFFCLFFVSFLQQLGWREVCWYWKQRRWMTIRDVVPIRY